jgi:hypothetical protein
MKASDWHRAGPKPSRVFARRTAPAPLRDKPATPVLVAFDFTM